MHAGEPFEVTFTSAYATLMYCCGQTLQKRDGIPTHANTVHYAIQGTVFRGNGEMREITLDRFKTRMLKRRHLYESVKIIG
jgi:hypothetical protein